MPYGNVSFVTKLSPLHPGYVSTVCASTLCSHPPNHTAITAPDNSGENMTDLHLCLLYSLLLNPTQIPDRALKGGAKPSGRSNRTNGKVGGEVLSLSGKNEQQE
jgi:hypothetical protein